VYNHDEVIEMPTDNPRITFSLSEEMRIAIDEFRYENRIKNQTQAILQLIQAGLNSFTNDAEIKKSASAETESASAQLTDEDIEVLESYHNLNADGKELIIDQFNILLSKSKYRQDIPAASAI
jgi:metal-responsive CopG/Arc/MetJ family transcriptional regulator